MVGRVRIAKNQLTPYFSLYLFSSKPDPSVAYAHAQMANFETWSDVTDQFFGMLK